GVNGELVWGEVESFAPWPAIIIHCDKQKLVQGKRLVEWYGQKTNLTDLKPFTNFGQVFCANSFATLATYKEAIFLSLEEAALRCKKRFSGNPDDADDLLKKMLDWALRGFRPNGPDGLKPLATVYGAVKSCHRQRGDMIHLLKPRSSPLSSRGTVTPEVKSVASSLNKLSCNSKEKSSSKGEGGKAAWEESTKERMKENERTKEGWAAEKHKKGGSVREKNKGGGWERSKGGWGKGKARGGWGGDKGGREQKKRSSLLDGFNADMSPDFLPYKKRTYTKIYKANPGGSVYTQPDQKLREETIRKIMDMKQDIEGFCLCCGTEKVEMFHPLFKGSLCLKSYCKDCLNILIGCGTFESLTEMDPWICYLCQPHQPHGALTPREDWSIRVQELFANNSAMEFEPHRVYPSIPANQRRPLRVLSLFDGIATGYLVLKDLGFKVETYVASEVCEDSVAVATVNHERKIIHVGDARFITETNIEQWGPFDLLIGGSPCNDLSIVNPIRKGLYEGTGRLFFEYYRILQLLKPKEGDPRPFFWLFENVVFMNTHDKVNICRFLECNRCWWMRSKPIIASQSDKLNLQDCLEIGREARVTKVRTITTNPNSLKQGKGVSLLPVLQDGKEDNLWITELEKIFGFPKHYTDVRNMNRQQRQKVLGKAWSVPVIRHLFAPLKDYFACEELLTVSTATSYSSASSSTSTSPPSPDPQQLR
ncbi:hypothetical protein INR49_004729, partial [Caranx melampygus]